MRLNKGEKMKGRIGLFKIKKTINGPTRTYTPGTKTGKVAQLTPNPNSLKSTIRLNGKNAATKRISEAKLLREGRMFRR